MADKTTTDLTQASSGDTGAFLYGVTGGNSRKFQAGSNAFRDSINIRTAKALDVRDYGALGDGTTDDATAIQAALDAAAAGSVKRVYVPHTASGYAISSTLTIDAGVTIFGDNLWGQELSRIKPTAGFSSPLLRTEDYGVTRKLRVGVIGLFFDGSSTTLTAVQLNIQESLIRDCTIKNCFTYGIHFGGISSGATEQALNNHIVDNYLAGQIGTTEFFDGIFIDYFSADNTIERNYIEASKDAGIRSRGYNNKITNNHIYSVAGTGGGVGAGIYTETSADHDISQNYIELCAAEGVLMSGGGSDVATLAAVVHGNVFRNIDTGDTSNGVIEIAGSDVSAVSVIGNVVRRDAATSYATPYFVYFNGITPTLQTVRGNSWQSGLIATAESNLAQAQGETVVNQTLTGYAELAEISSPSNPAANYLRVFAKDVAGTTRLHTRDSAGTESLVGAGFSSVVKQVFTASDTYTPTSGMSYCIAEVQAPGGGGGGADVASAGQFSVGGGGGGGEYARAVFSAATIGASQAITIGAVGTAGSGTGPTAGGTGGTTSIGTLLTCIGGSGGAASATDGEVNAGGAGGTGGGGTPGAAFRVPGGRGGDGFTIQTVDSVGATSNRHCPGTGGGSILSGYGSFATVANAVDAAGTAGPNYGRGGGGAVDNDTTGSAGGAGGAGIIIITEYIS